MANFQTAYKLTLGHEGGYANHPLDKGGETYKGIARKANPSWKGWEIIDRIKFQFGTSAINSRGEQNATLQSLVHALYKSNYWDAIKLDSVENQDIANALFDISVNMGPGTASKILQEALNLCNKNGKSYPDIAVDGKVGNITLTTVNRANAKVVFNTINLLKGERYVEIMRANKSQEVFWEGWLKRVILL